MRNTKRPKRAQGRPSNFRMTPGDVENMERLIRAGWAVNKTGAIRFALKYAADEKAA